MNRFYLSIDQGTTSSRAIVFDSFIAQAQKEFTQFFPQSGWVEHDGEEIWQSVCNVANQALLQSEKAGVNVVGIGITNQRETTLIWDRKTGKPIHRAIVWQDRRTSKQCQELISNGLEDEIADKAGLVIDPYFSASKIAWILDNVKGARIRAENGELAFGTIETFLIWRLTNGDKHISDATNASRTCLLNIKTAKWDKRLCEVFNVPMPLLPEIVDCAGWKCSYRTIKTTTNIICHRRPAKCQRWSSVFSSRVCKSNLWNRMLCYIKYWRANLKVFK